VSERFDEDTFATVWGQANTCGGDIHGPHDLPADVVAAVADGAEHVWAKSEQGDYAEGSSCAIGRTKDGRFVVVEESSDTTGHGCQCGASASIHDTLEEAVRLGLSQEWRDHYNRASKAKA
jgi:hypothetical protein